MGPRKFISDTSAEDADGVGSGTTRCAEGHGFTQQSSSTLSPRISPLFPSDISSFFLGWWSFCEIKSVCQERSISPFPWCCPHTGVGVGGPGKATGASDSPHLQALVLSFCSPLKERCTNPGQSNQTTVQTQAVSALQ